MKQIEEFTGLEDVERWIDRFELAIEIDGLEDKEAQILSMYLKGPAYDTWKSLGSVQRKSAPAIKSALREVYGMKRVDAWQSVLSRKVIAGENLDVAGEEIQKLVKIATADSNPRDSISALILLESLPKNIKEQVVLRLGNDFCYKDILSCAKKIWPTMQGIGSVGVGQRTDARTPQKVSYPRSAENNVRSNFEHTPFCMCCKRYGHLKKDCRIHCFKCGKQGHMKNECRSAVPLNEDRGTDQPVPRFSEHQQ